MTESRHDALWRRVEAHLDARTDPFQDAALARELRAVPEAERAARRVLARLGALRGAAPSVVNGSERAVGAQSTLSTSTPMCTLPSERRSRSRPALRVASIASIAAGAAAAAALVALLRETDAPQSESGPAIAALDARPELGVIYSARVEFEHFTPPPPRAALVVHESRHVFGWSLAGNPR